MDSNYSLSDIAAVTEGNRGGGMFGGNGDWGAWIILFLLFGMFGRGGWGGFGGNDGTATRADINSGFALNGLQTGITAMTASVLAV